MFLYRKDEISLLNEDFDKAKSSINFIFGRRKVGKTSLINEYTKNKKTLYLSAFETISSLFIKELKKTIDNFFDLNNSETINSLENLIVYLSKQEINNKIVIVFEDMQELLKIEKDFLINLNNYWTKYLKNLNMQLIISSSVLPNDFDNLQIANKIDNKIKLKSLSFKIIEELYPNMSEEQRMHLFTVFGTNPEYLSLYNIQIDFISNIKENFLSRNSYLTNEGMNLIKKDLGDAATYCSILYAISIGNNKIGDIAECLNLKSSYLTRYMQKLLDLMIINKIVPINESLLKSKFGRYEIEDNFLKFWFRYIYTNVNSINSNNYNKILKNIENDINNNLISITYKNYLKELIEENSSRFLSYRPKKIGSWWNNKDIEIDFITYDSKYITFIDCKYNNSDNLDKDYEILKNKASSFDTPLEKKYLIITKNLNINK